MIEQNPQIDRPPREPPCRGQFSNRTGKQPDGKRRLGLAQFAQADLRPDDIGAFGDQQFGRVQDMPAELQRLAGARLIDHPLRCNSGVDDVFAHLSPRLSRSKVSAGV
jgi:hypothetical protein